ncbi:MAG: response regulator [Gammaproteobacteria bacterium]|nr:MAG: response regulator [Gammaproteobacteria bacterium]
MSKRILVIDDEEGCRDAFVLALEDADYDIDTAENGLVGVEKAKAKPPDLIFLDLRMPKMDGIQALRELRGFMTDVPIYIVTAFYPQFTDQLKQAQDDGYIFELMQKPLGAEQIVEIVAGVLEGPRML